MGQPEDPQYTELQTARSAARFEREKIRRCPSVSKGYGGAVGDTSADNPDPQSPVRSRGQASRKGGRERGRLDEETSTAYPVRSRGRTFATPEARSRGEAHRKGHLEPYPFLVISRSSSFPVIRLTEPNNSHSRSHRIFHRVPHRLFHNSREKNHFL